MGQAAFFEGTQHGGLWQLCIECLMSTVNYIVPTQCSINPDRKGSYPKYDLHTECSIWNDKGSQMGTAQHSVGQKLTRGEKEGDG
jgi:hypothetical protein